MKAVICSKYGGPEVLSIQDVPTPSPAEDEILVKVQASSLTRADSMMRQGTPFYARLFLGLKRPKAPIPGTGFAGVVAQVGKAVKDYEVGEKVFGETGVHFGANAEYVTLKTSEVILKNKHNLDMNSLACLCDGPITSMNFLKNLGHIKPGDKALIIGASGSLGTAAVQLAKLAGAHVSAVCSGKNSELVKSLGADEVIDHTQSDFTKSSHKFDIIYDAVGVSSFDASKHLLNTNGSYICPVLSFKLLAQMLWSSKVGTKKAKFSATGLLNPKTLKTMLAEAYEDLHQEKIKVVISKTFSYDQVSEAHRLIDSGRKVGNFILISQE